MFKVEATAADGFKAAHRAWTFKGAIDWMRQYPGHVADTVTIKVFGRVVAVRIG